MVYLFSRWGLYGYLQWGMNALGVETPRWTPAQSNAKREPGCTYCLVLYTAHIPLPRHTARKMIVTNDSRIAGGICMCIVPFASNCGNRTTGGRGIWEWAHWDYFFFPPASACFFSSAVGSRCQSCVFTGSQWLESRNLPLRCFSRMIAAASSLAFWNSVPDMLFLFFYWGVSLEVGAGNGGTNASSKLLLGLGPISITLITPGHVAI